MPQQIRVLIADDHHMVRNGLKSLIEEQDDLLVVAEATNGREAIYQTGESDPDVIVMDINMPHVNGIEATQIISSINPQVRIIGLSFHEEEKVAAEIKSAGASAYLTKAEAFDSLAAVIRSEARAARE